MLVRLDIGIGEADLPGVATIADRAFRSASTPTICCRTPAAQGFNVTPLIYDTERQHAAADAAVALLIALLVEGTDALKAALVLTSR